MTGLACPVNDIVLGPHPSVHCSLKSVGHLAFFLLKMTATDDSWSLSLKLASAGRIKQERLKERRRRRRRRPINQSHIYIVFEEEERSSSSSSSSFGIKSHCFLQLTLLLVRLFSLLRRFNFQLTTTKRTIPLSSSSFDQAS